MGRELGRGGIGEVFLAYDNQLERWVAIKRIHMDEGVAEKHTQSALSEAKRLACLQHPNIVTVFDVLNHDGDVLMVMEYLHGYTLEELDAPLTLEDFFLVAEQSLEGLGAAHALGMIHLDIKSTNLMLTWLATGPLQVKLLDFGLATVMKQPFLQRVDTKEGLLGSVHTMAPEQLEQKPVGIYTDLYALGCVLYHALTRQDPFQGSTVAAVIDSHLRHRLHPLELLRPDLPKDVCAWVEQLMARFPEDRFPATADSLAALQAVSPQKSAELGNDVSSPGPPAKRGGIQSALHAAVVFAGKIRQVQNPRTKINKRRIADTYFEPISVSDKNKLLAWVNKPAVIEGKVERVWANMNNTIHFLNFEGVTHSDFSLVFPLKAGRPEFSKDRLGELLGQTIRATGTISEFHGSPQITVELPSQITLD
jgi:serine/threonine protein kinase